MSSTLSSVPDLHQALSHPLPDLGGWTLVFDLDGTLVETASDLIGTLNDLLARHDLPPVPVADARHLVGHGAAHLLRLGFARSGLTLEDKALIDLIEAFKLRYAERIADDSRPYAGVVEVLTHLKAKGAILSVCTNKPHGLTQQLLSELALTPLFASAIGADAVENKKPHRQHFDTAVQAAGGQPGRALMVGDSQTDIETARNAGVPVIAVSFGYSDGDIHTLGADQVIDHYHQLPSALAEILSTIRL